MKWDGTRIPEDHFSIEKRKVLCSKINLEKWNIKIGKKKEKIFAKKITCSKIGPCFPCFFEEIKKIVGAPYIETHSIYLTGEGCWLLFPEYCDEYKIFDLQGEMNSKQFRTIRKILAFNYILGLSFSKKSYFLDLDGTPRILFSTFSKIPNEAYISKENQKIFFNDSDENLYNEIRKIIKKIDFSQFRIKAIFLAQEFGNQDLYLDQIEDFFTRLLNFRNL